jgi:periplasmic protein TonB
MRYEIHHDAVLPPRAVTFVGIAALHVFFVYLFMSGLAQSAFHFIDEPLEFVPLKETKPQPPVPPPVSRPEFVIEKFDLPPPPDVPVPPPDATITARVVETPPGSGTAVIAPPPPSEPIRLIGSNRIPNAEHYYPPQMIRQGIEGATVVRACVDERGRLQGDPTVQRTSGYEAFDKGAIEAARDGRYARATQGGKPVPNCYDFRITFVVTTK